MNHLAYRPTTCRIPRRRIIIFLCFCLMCNNIVIRNLLNQTHYVWANVTDKHTEPASTHCTFTGSPYPNVTLELVNRPIVHLTDSTFETLGNVYYFGTLVSLIPAGCMADKRGARKLLLYYGITTAILTAFGPLVIQISNHQTFIVLVWRVLLGLANGVLYPSIICIAANWTLKHKRATVVGVINCTLGVASIVTRTLCKSTIIMTGYWQTPFYLWAVIIAGFTGLWYWLGYSSPNTDPHISREEKRFLDRDLGRSIVPFEKKKIPWAKMFTSLPFWANVVIHMGKGWLFFSMYIYSEKFFLTVLRIDFDANMFIGQLIPFSLIGLSTLFSGITCDFFVNRDLMDVTTARKMFSNFGAIGTGVYLVILSMVGCQQKLGYAIFCIMIIFYGLYDIGVSANEMDLAVNYAATMKGISETGEYISTFAVPLLLGELTKDRSMTGWRHMFLVILVVVLVTNLLFAIFGRAKEQAWNHSQIKEE